jgi:hypothetical protein
LSIDTTSGLSIRQPMSDVTSRVLPSLNVATTDSLTLCPVAVNDTVSGVTVVRTSDTGCGGAGVGAVGGTGEVDWPQLAIPNTVTIATQRTNVRTWTSRTQGDLQPGTVERADRGRSAGRSGGVQCAASMDFEILKRVLAALEARGVRYAIIGAVALNLHGLARSTEDLDIFVEPDADNIERLKLALHDVIDDPDIDEITAADLLGEYPAVQYVPPEGAFHLDILTRLGDAFRFADLETERVAYEDLLVTAVTPRMLYRMKRGTVRPKDAADAAAIRRRFPIDE